MRSGITCAGPELGASTVSGVDVSISRTFSIPIRRSSAATNSAARRTSAARSGSVEIDGIRSSAFSSSTNRSPFSFANATAASVVFIFISTFISTGRSNLRCTEHMPCNPSANHSPVYETGAKRQRRAGVVQTGKKFRMTTESGR